MFTVLVKRIVKVLNKTVHTEDLTNNNLTVINLTLLL